MDVGVEDDAAVDVARGTANGLDEAGLAAEEAFLVGVEDGHQRAFRDVEALAQEVDADEDVEHAQAQVADDLDTLQRIDVGMQVADADAVFGEVFGEVLGHALGEGCDEDSTGLRDHGPAFMQEVVDLVLDRADLGNRVDEAGGPDDLFGKGAAGAFHLPRARGGGDEDGLGTEGLPFLEAQGAVVHAAWKAEAELAEDAFAGGVAAGHAADLGDGDMAFVDDEHGVFGEIFKEGGRGARRAGGRRGRRE